MNEPKTNKYALRLDEATRAEREAQTLREAGKMGEASEAFDQAGRFYRQSAEHLRAAICFASAATCWNLSAGLQPLRKSALRSQDAAKEATLVGCHHYARQLFREAAILFERDGDYENYSDCFMAAQHAYMDYLWNVCFRGQKLVGPGMSGEKVLWPERLRCFLKWAFFFLSRELWGYGEKPFRTFRAAFMIVVTASLVYQWSGLVTETGGSVCRSLGDNLYFSLVTFTTVGYGDLLPMGWVRFVAALEALSGLFLMPLFLIGLTRRYLRVYH